MARNRVTRFLISDVIGTGIAEASPLVRAQSLRLAVTTLLETFPSDFLTIDPEVGRKNAQPLGQIAAAARLSPRALQEAFRRHLDRTPTAYLRDVRLQRAHAELRAAEPEEGTTVTDVVRGGREPQPVRRQLSRTPRMGTQ